MSNGVHSGGGGTCPGERSFFEERLFHMVYEKEEILQYIIEEDVKFIRMTFCDVMGRLKNVSIMPDELDRAFDYGIAIDASAVAGFGGEVYSDLVLRPDASTLCILPWRPEHGRVVRMFCSVHYPDGRPFEADTRAILARAVEDARKEGYTFFFGPEMEFYLFRLDESGAPTKTPYDHAGYMDVAPEDKGENVRREACLTLEQMGIRPESSHHEEGPGQNEIDFRYADPITAADNAVTFKSVVATVAAGNGLCLADGQIRGTCGRRRIAATTATAGGGLDGLHLAAFAGHGDLGQGGVLIGDLGVVGLHGDGTGDGGLVKGQRFAFGCGSDQNIRRRFSGPEAPWEPPLSTREAARRSPERWSPAPGSLPWWAQPWSRERWFPEP